jgi:hypothetical protein
MVTAHRDSARGTAARRSEAEGGDSNCFEVAEDEPGEVPGNPCPPTISGLFTRRALPKPTAAIDEISAGGEVLEMGDVTPPRARWTRPELDELGPTLRSYVESHTGDVCERVCRRCGRAFLVPRGSRQRYCTPECADADKARRYLAMNAFDTESIALPTMPASAARACRRPSGPELSTCQPTCRNRAVTTPRGVSMRITHGTKNHIMSVFDPASRLGPGRIPPSKVLSARGHDPRGSP